MYMLEAGILLIKAGVYAYSPKKYNAVLSSKLDVNLLYKREWY